MLKAHSPNTDTRDLHLQEIRDPIQRLMIRKFVEHTFNAHHNIKTIQYIDEIEKRKIPVINRLPDPVEKALQGRFNPPCPLLLLPVFAPGLLTFDF